MTFYVSEVTRTAPENFATLVQEKAYQALEQLNIPFERVDNDEAVTMEECEHINEKLDVKVVKNLFICNQQKTKFYLFITVGDKPFKTKDFSKALGISRVSFASPELLLEIMGTKVGSATVFSALLNSSKDVQIVFDKDIADNEWYGCNDGTPTSHLKLKTAYIVDDLMKYAKRTPVIIQV